MRVEFWMLIAGCLAAAVLIGWGVRRLRPLWPARRVGFVAASILPMLTIIWAIYLFVGAATGTAASCGTETCGMAMVGAVFIAIWALVVFFVGLALTLATLRLAARG